MALQCTPQSAPRGFEYYKLRADGVPENSFIIRHSSFRDVLYHPETAGMALQSKMEKAGQAFCRALLDLSLNEPSTRRDQLCELVFLSGGLFYRLNYGFKKELGFSLPQCFLGIRRVPASGIPGDFKAEISYENFESLPDEAVLLIGDTIATGATLSTGLEHLGDALLEEGKSLDRLCVVTLAGSLPGARRLQQTHERLLQKHPDLRTTFIAAEQLFHLMPDGTDLRFTGEDAVVPPATARETRKQYGPWLAQHMKCAVFDWGTRCKNPMAHYKEFEETAHHLLSQSPDVIGQKALASRLKSMQEERQLYHGPVRR